ISVSYITVDANGIIPLGLSAKAPYSAFEFRRLMQKTFLKEFEDPPKRNPLAALKNKSKVQLQGKAFSINNYKLSDFPIDHSISTLQIDGTREAALKKLKYFCTKVLGSYA